MKWEKEGAGGKRIGLRVSENFFLKYIFAEGCAITMCNKKCSVLPKKLSDFPFRVQNEPIGKFNSSPNYQRHFFNDRMVGWNNLSFVRIAAFLIIKDGYELYFKDNRKLSKNKMGT